MKKLLSFVLMLGLIFLGTLALSGEYVYAEESDKRIEVITDREYIEKFAEERNLDPSKIKDIRFVIFDESDFEINKHDSKGGGDDLEYGPEGFGDDFELRNIRKSGACGIEPLWITTGKGPGTLRQARSYSISATFSTEVSVDAEFISASLGFDVTAEYTVEDGMELELEAGEYGEIISYPMYRIYSFEIWEVDTFFDDYLGDGTAWKPIGICYVTNVG